LSSGKVSRPCLPRPVRRALPHSLWGGKEDAPDTATVLEMPRRCAALSQRLAAGRGQPRALIAVAHARMRRACAMGSHQAPPPYEAPTRVTSDHDTPPWIGWPGGLRLAGLACLWHG